MRRCLVDVFMAFVGLFCVIYLMNMGFGIIELIPDNKPFVGNIDEAAFTAILVGVLSYFGVDCRRPVRFVRRFAGREPYRLDEGGPNEDRSSSRQD